MLLCYIYTVGSGESSKIKSLSELFKPPFDIMFQGSFQEVQTIISCLVNMCICTVHGYTCACTCTFTYIYMRCCHVHVMPFHTKLMCWCGSSERNNLHNLHTRHADPSLLTNSTRGLHIHVMLGSCVCSNFLVVSSIICFHTPTPSSALSLALSCEWLARHAKDGC